MKEDSLKWGTSETQEWREQDQEGKCEQEGNVQLGSRPGCSEMVSEHSSDKGF